MKYYIDFEPIGKRGRLSSEKLILDHARELGVDLVNICGGAGICGQCKVQIISGDASPLTTNEFGVLSPEEIAGGFRLACQALPLSDCLIHVPPESLTSPQRTQVEGDEILTYPVDPLIRFYSLKISSASVEDFRSDTEQLMEALHKQHQIKATSIDIKSLCDLPSLMHDGNRQTMAVVRDNEIISFHKSDARKIGMAVDIGTTKIACYLVDMETGRTLAAKGIMNPQIAYGEDVIARIGRAMEHSEALKLQKLVVDALNQSVKELCDQLNLNVAEIIEAVVVGNTAMHHLFLRLPVKQLAMAPYIPAVNTHLDVKAREIGLHICKGAYVHLLPNIAGFVGADHVSMLLALDAHNKKGVCLAIDIGTNTEICLINNKKTNHKKMTSVSCASGPAFEGGHIKHGMRASNGAIEHVHYEEGRIKYQTIGQMPPVGICGSGILDALAQLYKAGIINNSGRLSDDHPSIRNNDGQLEFVLAGKEETNNHKEITLTQKDIRALQLAKAAIATGITMLLESQGLSDNDIDEVVIAGAFGSYIDVASAVAIGMLPDLPIQRFKQVGNAAGIGAKAALVSQRHRKESQDIADRTEYIELAASTDFMEVFTKATLIGPV
ncbi:MAG: DUF4445 domain-containing protein [Desulfobacteraceae bacterium]|nr:DUF4445 domain-containing protein [Desulfobacteraceae bacterium]MBC2755661.1 DUF4445 domain-containing protein [Desulfobacteraceae bacterium]